MAFDSIKAAAEKMRITDVEHRLQTAFANLVQSHYEKGHTESPVEARICLCFNFDPCDNYDFLGRQLNALQEWCQLTCPPSYRVCLTARNYVEVILFKPATAEQVNKARQLIQCAFAAKDSTFWRSFPQHDERERAQWLNTYRDAGGIAFLRDTDLLYAGHRDEWRPFREASASCAF
jgi:hypothetical protein